MRQALSRPVRPRRRHQPEWGAQVAFLPFPTQGWDTETPVAELPTTRARQFDNWLPKGTSGEMRKGFADWATGFSDPVETLLGYNAGATAALFAAAGGSIYNVTTTGAIGAASLSSLSNARFCGVNITTSGGSFLWICNGADDPRHWNGTAWATPALTVTTFSDNDIFYAFAFKERLFVLFKNSLTFGYLATQSIAGTVNNFPLGAVFNFGGRLIAGASLSRDGGAGLDDYAVFLTSEGEIAVYQGFNPASASEWALVGVYYVGEPVGDRPIVELGGDLGVITQNGLISVGAVMSGKPAVECDLFSRIATPFRRAIATGQGFSGWEGMLIPQENLLLVNAPSSTEEAVQFIRHHTTGGPGRFTGWNFETFEVFGGQCYAGSSDGRVVKCFTGHDDDGDDITATLETAWSTAGFPGVKVLQEIRPLVTTATRAVLRVVGRTDFREAPPLPAWPAGTVTNALIWGSGIWGTHLWGGEDSTTRQWRAISGEGHNVSLAVEARSNQSQFALNGFHLRFATGGQV